MHPRSGTTSTASRRAEASKQMPTGSNSGCRSNVVPHSSLQPRFACTRRSSPAPEEERVPKGPAPARPMASRASGRPLGPTLRQPGGRRRAPIGQCCGRIPILVAARTAPAIRRGAAARPERLAELARIGEAALDRDVSQLAIGLGRQPHRVPHPDPGKNVPRAQPAHLHAEPPQVAGRHAASGSELVQRATSPPCGRRTIRSRSPSSR